MDLYNDRYYDEMWNLDWYYNKGTWYWKANDGNGGNLYGYDEDTLLRYTNIYCAQHSQVIACPVLFANLTAKIEIRGNRATWYFLDEKGNILDQKTYEADINNLIAAILSSVPEKSAYGTEKGISYGGTSGQPKKEYAYTNQQKALFQKWNDWLDESGDAKIKAYKYSGNSTLKSENQLSNATINAYEKDGYTYNVDIYYLDVQKGEVNWTWGNGIAWTRGQNVIVVDRKREEKKEINISVKKVWRDNEDEYKNRPDSVTVNLLANDKKENTLTLNSSNSWSGKFKDLKEKDSSGKIITYSIEEVSVNGYNSEITGNVSEGFTITNTSQKTQVSVKKEWDDDDDRDGIRPASVKVILCENGKQTSTTATLNENNSWKYTFSDLPQYKDGEKVTYTVEEETPTGYTNSINGFVIKNIHQPEKIKISVTKVWDDDSDLDEVRPDSITVELYKNGDATGQKITLTENDNWSGEFTDLYKYESGSIIEYTVKEDEPKGYTNSISGDATNGYTIINTHEPSYAGYIEITGKVWMDGQALKSNEIDGKLKNTEKGVENVKVRLKNKDGKLIESTYSNEKGKFKRTDYAITGTDGKYTIRVNYDNSQNVYKLYEKEADVKKELETAYVEFEYDGMKYTTVATDVTVANTSKAKEDEGARKKFDDVHQTVTTSTSHPDGWGDKSITATTNGVISFKSYTDKTTKSRSEVLKYCNGDGKNIIRTNPDGAWNKILSSRFKCEKCTGKGHSVRTFDVEVVTIQNVNLGLFEREQPEVGIFSDLTKVEVTMNNQKYTYLYGVRSEDFADADMKAQFQNKDEYTYQRPVNPADISYIQEPANSDAMSVFVTYEVEVGNLSTTLPITVSNIINVYDTGYKSPTITIGSKTIGYNSSTIYGSKEARGFNEITLKDLGLTIQPGKRSEKIQITYEVSEDEIKGLFNGNASLHNAVEIHTYSIMYGKDTLYAEQGKGKRTNKPYGGYDYETHPGNAAIRKETVEYEDKYNEGEKYLAEILISTDGTQKIIPERDTDISPSFILYKDVSGHKILAGTVFEDKDEVTTDKERLGDGKYDSAREKVVQNVKVELFKLNADGTTTLANLYKDDGTTISAVTYSDENGNYSFGSNEGKYGVVTGEYYIKFTYGNDANEDGTKELKYATKIKGVTPEVNARNYKSTIITNNLLKDLFNKNYGDYSDSDKKWIINIEDNYSIAVDNMKDRLEIEDLQNSNFYTGENMTAYSKPFMTQVEFEPIGQSQVDIDGKVSAPNKLNKLDFGIAERPREDIFIQKRVTKLKITLANGQVLTEGNPSEQTLNYVKSMGQGQIFNTSAEARDFERRILVEMDTELIQGARIEVGYEVVVKNNNEIDYDYGTTEEYTDITGNNYITTNPNANYYYYGTKSAEQKPLETTIEIVDYLNNEVVYDEPGEGKTIIWEEKTASDLKGNGLISNDTSKALEEGKNYKIFKLASNDGKITLERGGTSELFTMSASKLLANKDENIYDNHTEIIKIDAKSARTIGINKDGEIIEKTYKPGDYVPALDADYFGEKNKQQDDDKVSVILTNSTGITIYIITYLIIGLIGLIVLGVVVIVIKKVIIK